MITAAMTARGDDAGLLMLLGDTALSEQDFEGAFDAYARAAAAAPDDGRAQLMAGWCALELGRMAEARRHLAAATRFPGQAEAARGLLARVGEGGGARF